MKKAELEFTGERFVPWADDPIMNYEHLHRYRFVKKMAKGKKVLDIGCGEGYGCFMISDVADKVTGVDISSVAVQHALNRYERDNLKFIEGSLSNIPVEGEELFDLIVCFEVLEHVEEQKELLKEAKRLLKKNGIFVISTPNKSELRTINEDYQNPYHVKELGFEEFRELIDGEFKNIILYGQRVYPSSIIFPLNQITKAFSEIVIEKKGREFNFSGISEKVPMYFIAIASDASLDFEQFKEESILLDVSETIFRNNNNLIRQLNETIKGKNNHINNLENDLKKKDEYIENIMNSLISKECQIQEDRKHIQMNEEKLMTVLTILKNFADEVLQNNNYPEISSLYLDIGEMLYKIGDIRGAKFCFEKVLSLDADNSDALNNLGVLNFQNNDYDNAEKHFLRSLEINPDNKYAINNLKIMTKKKKKSMD